MKIFIDGDGCPVVHEAVALAKKHSIPCTILCDTAHVIKNDYADTVIVSKGADSVDFALVGLISAGDIAVTQDYGLASMCLAKNARAISQNGLVFTNENIDSLLYTRYLTKKIKNSGGRVKGPSKRTKEQDNNFCRAFERLILDLLGA